MIKSTLFAAAAAAGLPLAVAAADLHMRVVGSVTQLTYADCQTYAESGSCTSWTFLDVAQSDFVSGANVRSGDAYAFDFVFDQEAPLSAVSPDGYQGIYFSAVREQSFHAGEIHLPGTGLPSANIGAISVVDGRSGYDSLLFQTVFGGEHEFAASLNLVFQDRTGQVFSSFELPSSIDLINFTKTEISVGFIRYSDGDQLTLRGGVAEVHLTPIPEPSVALLLSMGLMATGLAAYGRKAS